MNKETFILQLQLIKFRLKKPSILLSLISQIVTLLYIFKIDIDTELITSVITCITSILIILGIISNPDSKQKSYVDDFAVCCNCNKVTQHVAIGDAMFCKNCGCQCNAK